MRAAPDEQWHETEQALRRLLRDGVPQPATPADRMRQIRRRVQRRRRRRAAAAGAATAVAAVVACVALVPGLRPPGDVQPAAAAPERQRALPTATPPAGTTRLLKTVRLLHGAGLILQVPRSWHSLSVDDRATATGFVSSQPLSRPSRGFCPDLADDALPACVPLKALEEGGVLLSFRPAVTGKAGLATPLRMGEPVRAGKNCRILRGDTEIVAWGSGRAAPYGKPFEVRVNVCLREPSEATLATVTQVLGTAFPRVAG
ncbi:hypothetical protein [Actinacidiphila sp. bgisy160]|uniref:hypothetical protein n=1 Tax=Actinacidiphila sp. bgisy160 TaxID=3413796 RepID=UPI003D765B6B